MRIAALSDIHGNIAALEAVLADIARRGVDRIVNLGDILSGALFPVETAERLIPLGLPTISGNHERQVLTQDAGDMGESDRHAASLLYPRHKLWLANLPERLWLTDDILMVHGTPASDVEYFLETVTPEGARPATGMEVAARLGDIRAQVILCGHTHSQRAMRLNDGRLIVNPGSVGLPAYADDRPWPHRMEMGTPHARYAIVHNSAGLWTADLLAVEYDWETAANQADSRGRADWSRALRTGQV
jgi:putative phosphoesterase